MASVGFEDVRFLKPAFVGQKLTLNITFQNKRISKSRPQYGLAKFYMELVNQDKEAVLSMIDTIMIERDPDKL